MSTGAVASEAKAAGLVVCFHLVEAGPSGAALEFGRRRIGRKVAHGTVVGALPLGVILGAVREPACEGRFSAPTDHVPLLYAQPSLLKVRVESVDYGMKEWNIVHT